MIVTIKDLHLEGDMIYKSTLKVMEKMVILIYSNINGQVLQHQVRKTHGYVDHINLN
jgi:hypothetical protein